MDERFLQYEIDKQVDHALEECGEFISAVGKMRRWGAYSVNPLIPESERETNIEWVSKELDDVIRSCLRLRHNLNFTSKQDIEKAFPLYD